jgi:hypothetical membrane protein
VNVPGWYNFTISDRPSTYNNTLCEAAGWLWNWNMITTPLLLALAGMMKIRAVYRPHDNSFVSSKIFVSILILIDHCRIAVSHDARTNNTISIGCYPS